MTPEELAVLASKYKHAKTPHPDYPECSLYLTRTLTLEDKTFGDVIADGEIVKSLPFCIVCKRNYKE